MDKEIAARTLCAGLDVWDMLTGKIPFMCAVTGHKWGVRSESDRLADRFHCTRCGHTEYAGHNRTVQRINGRGVQTGGNACSCDDVRSYGILPIQWT